MSAKKTTPKKQSATAHKKTAAKTPTGIKEPPEEWQVRIRMHRQGVGDCFLVTFRMGDSPVNMLFDCGVLPGSKREFSQLEEVAKVIRNELNDTKGKLDVLVITHEHADHVSGFDPGKPKLSPIIEEIPIDNVWMAWTEDPDDDLAKKLHGTLAMHAMAAASTLAGMRKAGKSSAGARFAARAARSASNTREILEDWGMPKKAAATFAVGLREGGATQRGKLPATFSRTVRNAMEYVKSRVSEGRFQKLRPGRPPHAIPGISKDKVRVFVLGPPRLENLDKTPRHGPDDDIFHIASDKLPAIARNLAAAAMPREGADEDVTRPFSDESYCARSSASTALNRQRAEYRKHKWRGIDDDWLMSGEDFAIQLDSATNNTSLVLAIELVETGAVLLFPGDAQVENWETWRKLKWTVPDASGIDVEITGESLLQRTVFYKASHHGSHNGTLNKHGLALMPSKGLVVMVPVIHAVTSARKGDWKEIPKPSLCAALQQKCGEGFIRMDAPKGTLAGRLGGRVQEKDLYVDYYLP